MWANLTGLEGDLDLLWIRALVEDREREFFIRLVKLVSMCGIKTLLSAIES